MEKRTTLMSVALSTVKAVAKEKNFVERKEIVRKLYDYTNGKSISSVYTTTDKALKVLLDRGYIERVDKGIYKLKA